MAGEASRGAYTPPRHAPALIQYWEAHPSSTARRVLFVRVGQEAPLYDERTLRLLPER